MKMTLTELRYELERQLNTLEYLADILGQLKGARNMDECYKVDSQYFVMQLRKEITVIKNRLEEIIG